MNDDQDWRAWAACQDDDPEWWFPTAASHTVIYKAEVKRAKDICRTCPVIDECLRDAVRKGYDHGVWGGTSEDLRRRLRKPRPASIRKEPRDRATCGSEAGRATHVRKGERPCDDCRIASNRARARRAAAS